MVAITPILKIPYDRDSERRVYVPKEDDEKGQRFEIYLPRFTKRLPEGGLILVLKDNFETN